MVTYGECGDVYYRRKGVFAVQHVRGVAALATGKLNLYSVKIK